MSRLLNKPLKAFTLYSLIILMFSIPVYYLVIDDIWLNELDEQNGTIKKRIERGFNKTHLKEEELAQTLKVWNSIQPGMKLKPVLPSDVKKDSFYTILISEGHFDPEDLERFRVLSTYVSINGNPYHLTIKTNVEETDEIVLALAIVTFLFFVLLVIGFIVLNRRIAHEVWKPFRTTLDKLSLFDLYKQDNIQFEKSDIEEFEELNNVLTKLINKNISVFNQQKEFTENASHELQTPLALLKSKLDLLLQDKTLTQEQSEIITSFNIPLSRVSRINKNLLLLAKIENHQYMERETVDLSLLLDENLKLLTDYAESKNIDLEIRISEKMMVFRNKDLLDILLTNLLINAIRHNENNGKIIIELHNGIFKISNSGKAILNADTLFKRFATSSAETPSTGLGLAIVREICNSNGWLVAYSFLHNLHTFSVDFN